VPARLATRKNQFVKILCLAHNIAPASVAALVGVQLCVYAAATFLFFAVERPFRQLRHRIASRFA
jgi:hypothetical protein